MLPAKGPWGELAFLHLKGKALVSLSLPGGGRSAGGGGGRGSTDQNAACLQSGGSLGASQSPLAPHPRMRWVLVKSQRPSVERGRRHSGLVGEKGTERGEASWRPTGCFSV